MVRSAALLGSGLLLHPLKALGQLRASTVARVLPGVDVMAQDGFAPLQGRRVGLLTHPAGVGANGASSIDYLRQARGVRLIKLFGPEHGIYGDEKAGAPVQDRIDARTGLKVYSLYGDFRKPTPDMLRGLEVLCIDLQDIGTRSYTFVSAMKLAMEACFENGVAVVIFDRPNPLGGWMVDGPPIDEQWRSYVGAFPVPYVHGLTIGEIARVAKNVPGWLDLPEAVCTRGRLLVVPMQGWQRSMRWPQTGLTFVPTSPYIPTPAAALGYPMTGLGGQIGGWFHGIGSPYPFRMLGHKQFDWQRLASTLARQRIAGLELKPTQWRKGSRLHTDLYLRVSDTTDFRPTALSFHMMRLECALTGSNPFARATEDQMQSFNKHTGSSAWWRELVSRGAQANVEGYLAQWRQNALTFQNESKRFWLYR
ncbi:MAG: exo-beta-N-acetylmuramidase NamZ domain-containing protein [Opitutales bacterium]